MATATATGNRAASHAGACNILQGSRAGRRRGAWRRREKRKEEAKVKLGLCCFFIVFFAVTEGVPSWVSVTKEEHVNSVWGAAALPCNGNRKEEEDNEEEGEGEGEGEEKCSIIHMKPLLFL